MLNFSKNLFFVFCALGSLCSQAQIDKQWLIYNGKVKTNFVNDSNVYGSDFQNILNAGNSFSILGVRHPNNVFNKNPRNDLFIIYSDGSFFDSRKLNPYVCWPNSVSYRPSDPVELPKSYTINGPTNKAMEFLYLTKIYEDDDPPAEVSISNASNHTPLTVNTSYTTTMQVNHDFVPGTDVTLVIPKNLFDNCSNASLNFDHNVFEPSNIFQNSTSCSFNAISGMSITNNSIDGISSPEKFHYFNFKVKPNLAENFMGTAREFQLRCGGTLIASLVDTIRSGHDPSFIKVKCLFKRKIDTKMRYFALYHIQFQNNGNHVVDSVKVKFKLPPDVKSRKIKAFHWYYGGRIGCKDSLPEGLKIENHAGNFELSMNYPFLSPRSENPNDRNPSSKGVIEFCVELKRNPQLKDVDLKPIDARTYFNTKEAKFDYFFDPKVKKNREKIRAFNDKCDCHCKF